MTAPKRIGPRISDWIQAVHEKTLHILIEGIERILVPEHYQCE